MWYLYVLECGDGSLYTGITSDLERRVGEHQAGRGGRYTRAHLPVRPIAAWAFADHATAAAAEASFKQLRRAAKLRRVDARQPYNRAPFADELLSHVADATGLETR